MEVTDESIENDIAEYKQRIRTAESKLESLGKEFLPYQLFRKREIEKKYLLEEIRHAERLISFAQEALQNN